MESEITRQLSSSLFQEVKSHCVELSDISSHQYIEDVDTLIYSLRQISIKLTEHLKQQQRKGIQSSDQYVISTRLADYIFFPLSNLLKHPSLNETVVQYILEILAFLVSHSWSHSMEEALLDQLSTLVVFLTRNNAETQNSAKLQKSTKTLTIADKSVSFVEAASSCMVALIKCVPRDYYTSDQNLKKRLSILGDTTTTLLDILELFGKKNEENTRLILKSLSWLYSTRVSPEQTSFVFPGLVSRVINFHTKSKNISSDTLICILEILRALIVRVFSDKELGITVSEQVSVSDLSALSSFLEENEDDQKSLPFVRITFENPDKNGRTGSWLAATSKQLKLSLLIFMKNLILNPGSKTKVVSSPKLADEILEFVTEVSTHCFKALLNEVIPSTLDILAALYFVKTYEQDVSTKKIFLDRVSSLYLMLPRSDLQLLHTQVSRKTQDLISSQLSRILISSNEENICLCLAAIEVHLCVMASLGSVLLISADTIDALSILTLDTLSSGIAKNIKKGENKGLEKHPLTMSGVSDQKENTSSNTLDDVELPPHINAKKLGMVRGRGDTPKISKLSAKTLDLDFDSIDSKRQFFPNAYSKASESAFLSLVSFLGEYCDANKESIVSSLLINNDESADPALDLNQRTVSLWLSNALHKTSKISESVDPKFKVDDFLHFDSESDEENENTIISQNEETNYLLLQTAQELLHDTKAMLESPSSSQNIDTVSCENAYTVALQTTGILAGRLSKSDFQTDVLMDYLYPILEALAYTPESPVHLQARISLSQIIDQHYGGSIQALIQENADYLIDSLSMNLSMASGLKPSLPGILLVVIRISGADLLLSNHLQDILSEIFIVIDSFHGYSSLVQNFFLVFEEIVTKIKQLYSRQLSNSSKLQSDAKSPYKPWGMSARDEMLYLINDANKLVDPFGEYDSNKEYFERKPNMPFGEQAGDSDDEEDSEETPPEVPEIWPSPVPKTIYASVQQLFTYGLQLLSHPSVKLKIQILRTLEESYSIMASNYKALMPIIAQYWPLLLAMSAGVPTLTDDMSDSDSSQVDQLIVPTVELMTRIFEVDDQHEQFMASRFIDMWDFMKRKVPEISRILADNSLKSTALANRHPGQKKLALYSKMLINGMEIYQKALPDLTAHEMARACYGFGIDPAAKLGKSISGHLWVLKNFTGAQFEDEVRIV